MRGCSADYGACVHAHVCVYPDHVNNLCICASTASMHPLHPTILFVVYAARTKIQSQPEVFAISPSAIRPSGHQPSAQVRASGPQGLRRGAQASPSIPSHLLISPSPPSPNHESPNRLVIVIAVIAGIAREWEVSVLVVEARKPGNWVRGEGFTNAISGDPRIHGIHFISVTLRPVHTRHSLAPQRLAHLASRYGSVTPNHICEEWWVSILP